MDARHLRSLGLAMGSGHWQLAWASILLLRTWVLQGRGRKLCSLSIKVAQGLV